MRFVGSQREAKACVGPIPSTRQRAATLVLLSVRLIAQLGAQYLRAKAWLPWPTFSSPSSSSRTLLILSGYDSNYPIIGADQSRLTATDSFCPTVTHVLCSMRCCISPVIPRIPLTTSSSSVRWTPSAFLLFYIGHTKGMQDPWPPRVPFPRHRGVHWPARSGHFQRSWYRHRRGTLCCCVQQARKALLPYCI